MSADWMLPDEAVEFISRRVKPHWTIVELGSGKGSKALANLVPQGRLFSVEHDPTWVGVCGSSTYIHAPIRNGWYDADILREQLPPRYDCIVVDGPPGGIGRMGFLKNLELFRDVPIIVDDAHRKPEFELAVAVAGARNKSMSIHYVNRRAFASLGWVL